jgi:hypothetical protein
MPRKKPRTKAGKKRKVHKTMSEFKRGKLKSGSGKKVTNRKQAIAIGLRQAGIPPKRKKRKRKKKK